MGAKRRGEIDWNCPHEKNCNLLSEMASLRNSSKKGGALIPERSGKAVKHTIYAGLPALKEKDSVQRRFPFAQSFLPQAYTT